MTEENKTDNLPNEPDSESTDREDTPVGREEDLKADEGFEESPEPETGQAEEADESQNDSDGLYAQTIQSAETTADEIYSGETEAETSESEPENEGEAEEPPAEETAPPEKEPEPVSDDFKPYYKGEARKNSVVKIGLFILMAALGVFLIGMGVDTFIQDTPFKVESTAIIIICLAIVGVLWKTISLEAKTGIFALGTGLVLFLSNTLYSGHGLGAFGLDPVYILAGFHCLVILALLIGIFKIIPKFWVKLVLTIIVLYGALAPVWPFITGPAESAFINGPPFLSGVPSVLGSGWILAQVILPLGMILTLYLQGRILLRPQYDTHWGFLFWALCMIIVAFIGLSELERSQKPVFPALNQTIANAFPSSVQEPPAPVEEPAPPEAASKPVGPETGTESATPHPGPGDAKEEQVASAPETAATEENETSFPKPEETVAEPDKEPTSESEADVKTPDESETGEETEEAGIEASPEKPAPDPGQAAAGQTKSAEEKAGETKALARQIEAMDKRIAELQDRLDAQERLIRALLDYFGDSPGFEIKPEQHGVPKPPLNEAPTPPPVESLPPSVEPLPPIDEPVMPPIDKTMAPDLPVNAI